MKDTNSLNRDMLRETVSKKVAKWFGEPVLAVEDEVMELIQEAKAEERKRCLDIIRSHILMDWSGETEVYEEIENIAKNIELPDQAISAISNKKIINCA